MQKNDLKKERAVAWLVIAVMTAALIPLILIGESRLFVAAAAEGIVATGGNAQNPGGTATGGNASNPGGTATGGNASNPGGTATGGNAQNPEEDIRLETPEANVVEVAVDEGVSFIDEYGNVIYGKDVFIDAHPITDFSQLGEMGLRIEAAVKKIIKAARNVKKARCLCYDISAYVKYNGSMVRIVKVVGGEISIKIGYPDGVGKDQQITVLHYDERIKSEKNDNGLVFGADSFSPFTIVALEIEDDDDDDDTPASSSGTSQTSAVTPGIDVIVTAATNPQDTAKQGAEAVKSGDNAPIGIFLIMAVLSAIGGMICVVTRKRKVYKYK